MRCQLTVPAAVVVMLTATVHQANACPGNRSGLMEIAQVRRASAGQETLKRPVAICGQVTIRPGDLPDDLGNF